MKKIIAIYFIALLWQTELKVQYSPVTIPGSEVRKFTSLIVEVFDLALFGGTHFNKKNQVT